MKQLLEAARILFLATVVVVGTYLAVQIEAHKAFMLSKHDLTVLALLYLPR